MVNGCLDPRNEMKRPSKEKTLSSTRVRKAPKRNARVAYLNHQANSLYVGGFVNDKHKLLLRDRGATRTIVRTDMLGRTKEVRPTSWRLRTATGETEKIHGEAEINLRIGNTGIEHQALLAEIKNGVRVGNDVMGINGFQQDLNF